MTRVSRVTQALVGAAILLVMSGCATGAASSGSNGVGAASSGTTTTGNTPCAADFHAAASSGSPAGSSGAMGPAMMSTGHAVVSSPAAVNACLRSLEAGVTIDASHNTVRYTTSAVTLLAIGAPPGRPGMYWQVDGRVNPTVIVPSGATLRVLFADGDAGTWHGWELTSSAPPYPSMAMMWASTAAPGAFVTPVAPPRGNQWYSAITTIQALAPGTYYYLCPVPGHAQRGMWGRLVVT